MVVITNKIKMTNKWIIMRWLGDLSRNGNIFWQKLIFHKPLSSHDSFHHLPLQETTLILTLIQPGTQVRHNNKMNNIKSNLAWVGSHSICTVGQYVWHWMWSGLNMLWHNHHGGGKYVEVWRGEWAVKCSVSDISLLGSVWVNNTLEWV